MQNLVFSAPLPCRSARWRGPAGSACSLILAFWLAAAARGQQAALPDPAHPAPATAAPAEASAPSSTGLQQLVNMIIVDNMPHRFEDENDWGKKKSVWDGVRIWREGLRIKTKRRKKEVNHGTWTRSRVDLVNPDQEFQIRIGNIKPLPGGHVQFDAYVDALLDVFARLSEWQLGVQLISISANADARVELRVQCDLGMRLDPTKLPPDVLFDARVTDAQVRIVDFRLRRISQLGGPLVKQLSHQVREVLENEIDDRRPKIVNKINSRLKKDGDLLRLSLHDALTSKWGDTLNEHFDLEEMP